ncbi:hypothetical protein [uncultured Fibrella sp.]|uniref:hypothetical protein n=1 Tax=uncultured Fibrella sp. TaxID=1284596 RepID=UPI0035CC6936
MKKLHLLYLAATVLAGSCKQNDDLKLYNQSEISGRAILVNTDADIPPVNAAKATIMLVDGSQPTRYLYSVTAGDDGKFILPYQPERPSAVSLVARYTDKTNLLYEGTYPLDALPVADSRGDREVELSPQYKKGNLKVTVSSPDGTTGLVGAMVYLFANATQANSFSTSSLQGALKQLPTNAKGTAFFDGLDDGVYWVASKLDTLLTPVTSTTIAFNKTITTALPLTSKPAKTPVQVHELIVNVKDSSSEPLVGFQVHLFTNKIQADSVVNTNPPLGAIKTTSTSANGQARFSPVDVGTTYYIKVVGKIGQQLKVAPTSKIIIAKDPLTTTFPIIVN